MTGIGSHHSARSMNEEWLTPPEILKELGPFDLDPCAPVIRPWEMAAQHYTAEENGLSLPWTGFVWANPPYGKHCAVWLERMAEHDHGIALVFARTETEMFQEHIWPCADALFFLHGRIHFHYVTGERAKGNCGGPSVLIAYGGEAAHRLEHCNLDGTFVHGWRKSGPPIQASIL